MSLEKDRVGEEFVNSQGLKFKIIAYRGCEDIDIEFEDGYIAEHTCYKIFSKGQPINPTKPYIYGVGYRGVGKYVAIVNGKRTKLYDTWRDMIRRCYDPKERKIKPKYVGCTVCEEWHNYQNFAKWYEENFYQIEGEEMQLDKDLLGGTFSGYSPTTCVFLPKSINSMLKIQPLKNKELPRGVTKYGDDGYRVHIFTKSIGTYKTIREATIAYKTAQKQHLNEVSEKYKDLLPDKVYKALQNYDFGINLE